MANIARSDMFDNVFGDLMKGFAIRPLGLGRVEEPAIRMDVRETDKGYSVHADIPGVKKDDIKVTVDGAQVTISAEVKRESEKKEEGKVVHSERYEGHASRSFSLPFDIDTSAVVAKYQDGVLDLDLPKKAGSSTRQVAIQ